MSYSDCDSPFYREKSFPSPASIPTPSAFRHGQRDKSSISRQFIRWEILSWVMRVYHEHKHLESPAARADSEAYRVPNVAIATSFPNTSWTDIRSPEQDREQKAGAMEVKKERFKCNRVR